MSRNVLPLLLSRFYSLVAALAAAVDDGGSNPKHAHSQSARPPFRFRFWVHRWPGHELQLGPTWRLYKTLRRLSLSEATTRLVVNRGGSETLYALSISFFNK